MNLQKQLDQMTDMMADLHERVWLAIPDGLEGRPIVLAAAKEIGLKVSGKRMEMRNEFDHFCLSEMLNYEANSSGVSTARHVLEHDRSLTPRERQVLEAMANAVATLYEIRDTDRAECRLLLTGLLDESGEKWVYDFPYSGFSKGTLIFTRIVTIDGLSVIGGVILPFIPDRKDILVRKLSAFSRLKNPHMRSRKRFAEAVKLLKLHGMTMA